MPSRRGDAGAPARQWSWSVPTQPTGVVCEGSQSPACSPSMMEEDWWDGHHKLAEAV